MTKTRNPYRRSKNYQFWYNGAIIDSRYCTPERATKIAGELEKKHWFAINSVYVSLNPNA